MSDQTIRDVVIRVNIERGTSNLSAAPFDTIRNQADLARKSIDQATASLDRFHQSSAGSAAGGSSMSSVASLTPLSSTRNRLPSLTRQTPAAPTANSSSPASNGGNFGTQQLKDATTQLIAMKSAAEGAADAKQKLGNSTSSVIPLIANFAKTIHSEIPALGSASSELGEMSQLALGAGQSMSIALTAAKFGLKLYSEALKQVRDETREYWQEIAEDAQTAVAQQQRAISRRAEQGQRRLEAASIDITDSQLAPKQIKAQADREALIRREQAKLADRPLAERQEVRERIERKGKAQDEKDSIQAKIDHHEKHLNQIATEKQRLQGDSDKAEKLHKSLEKPREESRVKASPLGEFATTAVSGLMTISGLISPATLAHTIGGTVVNSLGGTTTRDETEDRFRRQKSALNAAGDAANAKKSAADGIARLNQDEVNTRQQIMQLKQQKHGVTVREQRETRAIAEQGQESLTNKMLKFGSADETTKATLREIQRKADQGIELNHLEKGLADTYGIGASQQARKQSLASAQSPENAKLFAHDIEQQKQREKDANDAESQPVMEEQTKLEDEIGKMSDEIKEGTNRLVASLEEAFKVDDLIDKISDQLEAQATELKRLQTKLARNWF